MFGAVSLLCHKVALTSQGDRLGGGIQLSFSIWQKREKEKEITCCLLHYFSVLYRLVTCQHTDMIVKTFIYDVNARPILYIWTVFSLL